MSSNNKALNLLQNVEPVNLKSYWNNDRSNKKSKKSLNKWRLDEKRVSPSEFFGRKDLPETFLLGPGAGAGVGCGAGIGFGLVGGMGFSGWPWNHLRLAFGFGAGCGVGAGFGYGQGFGYGSSWESIKDDFVGKKKVPRNRARAVNQFC